MEEMALQMMYDMDKCVGNIFYLQITEHILDHRLRFEMEEMALQMK